jgi:hypothetical protein
MFITCLGVILEYLIVSGFHSETLSETAKMQFLSEVLQEYPQWSERMHLCPNYGEKSHWALSKNKTCSLQGERSKDSCLSYVEI